mmetsp:Transcript_62234/g.71351  ORF Transcript_62234/g.71351 Transcript_62234/m.71351 type:complete len:343 (+) Transcript_62234:1-1029(+)
MKKRKSFAQIERNPKLSRKAWSYCENFNSSASRAVTSPGRGSSSSSSMAIGREFVPHLHLDKLKDKRLRTTSDVPVTPTFNSRRINQQKRGAVSMVERIKGPEQLDKENINEGVSYTSGGLGLGSLRSEALRLKLSECENRSTVTNLFQDIQSRKRAQIDREIDFQALEWGIEGDMSALDTSLVDVTNTEISVDLSRQDHYIEPLNLRQRGRRDRSDRSTKMAIRQDLGYHALTEPDCSFKIEEASVGNCGGGINLSTLDISTSDTMNNLPIGNTCVNVDLTNEFQNYEYEESRSTSVAAPKRKIIDSRRQYLRHRIHNKNSIDGFEKLNKGCCTQSNCSIF